ncbi:MAG: orotidine 5'-phosphate decarboxylase / HUMPS family protein [Candidatus Daviesbacteria bacterium]|nr:orotidine 5'-phosphate decarboxylase / HUMPS family protein [Candidatus Daviesbacteria bacterium]
MTGSADRLIERDRSVIVAADVATLDHLDRLVIATHDVEGIGGYKIGFALGYRFSAKGSVDAVRAHTRLPVMWDHQKAATDIPDMSKEFASIMKEAGVDAAILFPQSGPATQESWTKSLQDAGVRVLTGLHMTHPKFLKSEGGYIDDTAPLLAFELAARLGVTDFIVPGNKLEAVQYYKESLDQLLGEGNYTLNAPGFITQGGEISEMAKVAGPRWNAIVGSAIYKAADMRAAAELVTANIR